MYAIWPICLCPFFDVEALLWLISLPARIVDLRQSPSAILASTFREKKSLLAMQSFVFDPCTLNILPKKNPYWSHVANR